MAIVTVADLRNYMSDVSLSNKQQAIAEMVLNGTQQSLEIYLGRPVSPVQVREKRRCNDMGDIALSVTPVIHVISIRAIGTDQPSDVLPKMIELTEEELASRLVDMAPDNDMIVPGGIFVGRGPSWWVIEYVGGYNGYVDDAMKLAILEVASRTMTFNTDDVLSIKSDFAHEPSGAATTEKGWKESELQQFDRLRRRTAYR
jgi:hypothetical protein